MNNVKDILYILNSEYGDEVLISKDDAETLYNYTRNLENILLAVMNGQITPEDLLRVVQEEAKSI